MKYTKLSPLFVSLSAILIAAPKAALAQMALRSAAPAVMSPVAMTAPALSPSLSLAPALAAPSLAMPALAVPAAPAEPALPATAALPAFAAASAAQDGRIEIPAIANPVASPAVLAVRSERTSEMFTGDVRRSVAEVAAAYPFIHPSALSKSGPAPRAGNPKSPRDLSMKELGAANGIGVVGSILAGILTHQILLGLLGTFVAAIPLIFAYVGIKRLLGDKVNFPRVSFAPRFSFPGAANGSGRFL